MEGGRQSGRQSGSLDDLTVLATGWFGTSVMLSSEGKGPVAHESTRE